MKNTLKNKKKNLKPSTLGFTLIELLAVIVILAIIALIATPIILGIVEDARKDSFMRSVELVIKATDIDIFSKNYNDTYTYTINDGNISNLEIGVKNTDGMNGSITYYQSGKEEYAIHNGKYCVIKTSRTDKAKIKDYVEGECVVQDNRVFAVLTSKVPNENDVLLSTNGQLINLGEYGIRYQGIEPDNYVYFNCSDYSNQSAETCEIWRIIGIVDEQVKIVKNESIGNMKWDYDDYTDTYDNNWSDSTLKTYLNSEYLTSMISKNNETKNMILPSTWYLRGNSVPSVTKDEMYNLERTTGKVNGNNPEYIDNTEVGIMYSSDYGYAAMETESCLATTTLLMYSSCKESNWLSQGSISATDHWLITPHSNGNRIAFFASASGFVSNGGNYYYVGNSFGVLPTLYLTSETVIEGGLGTKNSPYKLSHE